VCRVAKLFAVRTAACRTGPELARIGPSGGGVGWGGGGGEKLMSRSKTFSGRDDDNSAATRLRRPYQKTARVAHV
jgi:hypothetical protein